MQTFPSIVGKKRRKIARDHGALEASAFSDLSQRLVTCLAFRNYDIITGRMQTTNDDKACHLQFSETPVNFRVHAAAVIYLTTRPALIAAMINDGSLLLSDRCNKKVL